MFHYGVLVARLMPKQAKVCHEKLQWLSILSEWLL